MFVRTAFACVMCKVRLVSRIMMHILGAQKHKSCAYFAFVHLYGHKLAHLRAQCLGWWLRNQCDIHGRRQGGRRLTYVWIRRSIGRISLKYHLQWIYCDWMANLSRVLHTGHSGFRKFSFTQMLNFDSICNFGIFILHRRNMTGNFSPHVNRFQWFVESKSRNWQFR